MLCNSFSQGDENALTEPSIEKVSVVQIPGMNSHRPKVARKDFVILKGICQFSSVFSCGCLLLLPSSARTRL